MRRRIAAAVASLLIAPAVSGAELGDFLRGDPPPPVVFKSVGGQKFSLFRFPPADAPATGPRPALVFIHGGGWMAGDADIFFPHARYFASRGLSAFSVEYRLLKADPGSSFNDGYADCASAVRYLRAHAVELGVDPKRVAVLGDSAGGHLAAALGTRAGADDSNDDVSISAAPDAMILCNPIVDMTDAGWVKYVIGGPALAKRPRPEDLVPSEAHREEARRCSPLFQVRPGQPPALLIHGLDDRVVLPGQARAFAEAAKKAGNRCDLRLIEGANHAFILANYTAPEATVVAAICAADRFLGSLGYVAGEPTLQVSSRGEPAGSGGRK
jgi:acetyl esterase